jgi:hypothetical protein
LLKVLSKLKNTFLEKKRYQKIHFFYFFLSIK